MAVTPTERRSSPTARILLVDDDEQVRRLLQRLLEREGHVCEEAADAAQAGTRLQEPGIELVLCDVNMPGESGLDLVRRISREHPDVAAVMVTGLDDRELAQTALDIGAYGYVTKPFRANELLINVANALRRRALEVEARAYQDKLEDLLAARTSALRRAAAQQRAVADLGQRALYGLELHLLFEEALRLMRAHLGVDRGAILELRTDREGLACVASVGWEPDLVGVVVPPGRESDAGRAITEESPVVIEDLASTDLPGPLGLADVAVRSALAVLIRQGDGAFGALALHAKNPRVFSDEDVNFVQAVANVLGTAIGRRGMEERLRHQALHDPLTGLPNRSLLADRLEQALRRASRSAASVGILFIDLDHFKTINDSLGHRAGDRLLVAVATRLEGVVRPTDTISRFGGDEFVILCEQLDLHEKAAEIAERVGESLRDPFRIDGETVFVTASIGIALGHPPGTSAEVLLRNADAAMYRAKEQGRGRFELFDARERRRLVERMRLQNALRLALERDEIAVHYQPLIDLTTGEPQGFEALARWHHPERGVLPPGQFIPLAEDSALIVALGRQVLGEACRQLIRWSNGGRELAMSVNVAARQLADPTFADEVAGVLEELSLAPERLMLEITETSIVAETRTTARSLSRLHDLGVRIVLDDFGTGYSALAYLRRLPLDAIKLDRTFLRNVGEEPSQRALVGGVVNIAHALGLQTVAEGIESRDQADAARELGFDLAQGYLFARPGNVAAIDRMLEAAEPPWLGRLGLRRNDAVS